MKNTINNDVYYSKENRINILLTPEFIAEEDNDSCFYDEDNEEMFKGCFSFNSIKHD